MDSQETKQKLIKTQQLLEQSEQRYKTLISNISLGIYRRTPGSKGKFIMVNPALVKMFNYKSKQQLKQIPVIDLYFHSKQCEIFSNKLFLDGEVIREKLQMKNRDGSSLWVFVTATAICNSNGDIEYFDGIMEDITDLFKHEEELKIQRQKLLQADKMISLGILVSGVAHEINNPNQFVVSHLYPMEKAWKDALPVLNKYYEQHGDFMLGGTSYTKTVERLPVMFKNIKEGTTRITRIVNDLRDYVRDQPSGSTEIVDINQVIKKALVLLHNLIRKHSAGFYVNYAQNIPGVSANFQKLEQVIINLVENSCQSFVNMPGEISISTFVKEQSNEICIQIDDTGCGISKENLKRIMDPFFTTKRELGGTGLGLSICNTIIQSFGGRLEFYSEPEEGTTVKLILKPHHEKIGKSYDS